jgi:hypothetical protein
MKCQQYVIYIYFFELGRGSDKGKKGTRFYEEILLINHAKIMQYLFIVNSYLQFFGLYENYCHISGVP